MESAAISEPRADGETSGDPRFRSLIRNSISSTCAATHSNPKPHSARIGNVRGRAAKPRGYGASAVHLAHNSEPPRVWCRILAICRDATIAEKIGHASRERSRFAQAKMIAERDPIGVKTVHYSEEQIEVDTGARPGITSDGQAEIKALKTRSSDSIKSGEVREQIGQEYT